MTDKMHTKQVKFWQISGELLNEKCTNIRIIDKLFSFVTPTIMSDFRMLTLEWCSSLYCIYNYWQKKFIQTYISIDDKLSDHSSSNLFWVNTLLIALVAFRVKDVSVLALSRSWNGSPGGRNRQYSFGSQSLTNHSSFPLYSRRGKIIINKNRSKFLALGG